MTHAIATGKIIELLGGTTALASEISVKPPSITSWRRCGIPEGRLIELGARIEQRSNGDLPRWDLRPHDWHLIWPELVDTPGAPQIPNKREAA